MHKLKCLGLLWCDGDVKEKVPEFYDILQQEGDASIAHNDKDFKSTLFCIFDFSSQMVFEQEVALLGEICQVPPEKIEAIKEEMYEELMEDFEDAIFDADSKLVRKDFEEELVSKKQGWIF